MSPAPESGGGWGGSHGIQRCPHVIKRKLRHREGRLLAQSHPARGWSRLDVVPSSRGAPSHSPGPVAPHLPHDPGHQHHGGVIEGVEESDEQLSLGSQLAQGHAKDNGEDHQAQDIHTLHLIPDRHLWARNRLEWETETQSTCTVTKGLSWALLGHNTDKTGAWVPSSQGSESQSRGNRPAIRDHPEWLTQGNAR